MYCNLGFVVSGRVNYEMHLLPKVLYNEKHAVGVGEGGGGEERDHISYHQVCNAGLHKLLLKGIRPTFCKRAKRRGGE